MGLELEIHAEWYQRYLLKKTARTGKEIIVPVYLYTVHMRVPFEYHLEIDQNSISVRMTVLDRRRKIVYVGQLGAPTGFDPDLLLALGVAVPKEQLRKPYTFFEQFVKGPDGTTLLNENNTGLITLDGIAAYGSRLFARRSA